MKLFKSLVYLSLMLLVLPCLEAVAGESLLSVSVNRNQISSDSVLKLEVELKNAKAKSSPNTEALAKIFKILGVARSNRIQYINGKKSQSTSWSYSLVALKMGELLIPEISIETSQGIQKSAPIKITITQAKAIAQQDNKNNLAVQVSASNNSPYVNEAFVYIAQIISNPKVVNLEMDVSQSSESIVEQIGKNRNFTKIIDGVRYNVNEIRYLVTPLLVGNLKLPVINVRGSILSKEQPENPLANFNIRGFGNFGGFGNMANSMFANYDPVRVRSKKSMLKVKAPENGVNPWLPLQSLLMYDEVSSHFVKVGEPITRKITVVGKGMAGSQLPSLEKMLQGDSYSVYAEKAETDQQVLNNEGTITGTRVENYTIVPQKEGKLVFPEIKVSWWNVRTKKMDNTVIPSKVVNVVYGGDVDVNSENNSENNTSLDNQDVDNDGNKKFVWSVLFKILAGVLVLLAFWMFIRRKSALVGSVKVGSYENIKEVKTSVATVKIIKKAETEDELLRAVVKILASNFELSENLSLQRLVNEWSEKVSLNGLADSNELLECCSKLENTLYGGKKLSNDDFLELKESFYKLLNDGRIKANKAQKDKVKYCDGLNPS